MTVKKRTAPFASQHPRIVSIDSLRGLIIALMALDHANYFIAQRHPPGEHWGGSFPSYKTAIAFMTRFVTHLSAPGFFFLMGIGVILFYERRSKLGWSRKHIRRHLLSRGCILILLQYAVVNPIWKISSIPFPTWYQGVLVALGATMMIASLLLQINDRLLLGITLVLSLVIEFSHPDPSLWGTFNQTPLALVFGVSGGTETFWVNYPILTWLEFVTFGMVFGHWYKNDPDQADRRASQIGIMLLLAFIPIRLLNGFGNVRPLNGDSWIDFLNVVKYPPSLSFTTLTMGINLLLLRAFAYLHQKRGSILSILEVFGRVPLFLYVVHLLLYALLGMILTPEGSSYALMYALWLGGLILLYPLAKLYARLKSKSSLRPVLQFL